MGKELDIEDEKFETLLADKRHKELTVTLKAIAANLLNNSDKEVVNAINGQGDKIGDLVKAIQAIPKPEKPQVNVDVNQDKVISSLQQICTDIVDSNNKVIEALEKRLLPDTFTLVKSYGGVTESVKVNYKTSNQLIVKK